jgi:hypothetical protein
MTEPRPAVILAACGCCFFRGREFVCDPECPDHGDDADADDGGDDDA